MLRKTYDWTMSLAGHKHAVLWLALVSFVESSVFPIPPDILLIPMVLAARPQAFRLALICTLASVTGGWLGYAIGYYLFELVGQPVFALYGYMEKFEAFKEVFNAYGAWIVLIKGMTPIPYKLITITAGATHLDFWIFTISSIGSRAMRFFLVAGLLWAFGPIIRDFIERRLTLVTTVFAIFLVGGFVVVKYLV